MGVVTVPESAVERVERMAAEATRGRWEQDPDEPLSVVALPIGERRSKVMVGETYDEADAELMAAAPLLALHAAKFARLLRALTPDGMPVAEEHVDAHVALATFNSDLAPRPRRVCRVCNGRRLVTTEEWRAADGATVAREGRVFVSKMLVRATKVCQACAGTGQTDA